MNVCSWLLTTKQKSWDEPVFLRFAFTGFVGLDDLRHRSLYAIPVGIFNLFYVPFLTDVPLPRKALVRTTAARRWSAWRGRLWFWRAVGSRLFDRRPDVCGRRVVFVIRSRCGWPSSRRSRHRFRLTCTTKPRINVILAPPGGRFWVGLTTRWRCSFFLQLIQRVLRQTWSRVPPSPQSQHSPATTNQNCANHNQSQSV